MGATVTATVMATFIVALPAAPAYAHESIQSTSPAEETVVETAPERIVLEYTDEVLPMGAIIIVDDTDGADWVVGDAVVDQNTVTAELEPGMPDGVYNVRWRAISADGHPISDIYQFGVGTSTQLPSSAAPSATTQSDASEAPVAAEADTNANQTVAASWVRGLLIAATGAVVALGLVMLGITLGRRRSTPKSGAPSTDNTTTSSKDD
ncbi:copper resistance CopC family protein [Agromyces sp. Marseille-Q5079]|uniref:copper resistance CopC family protein n=1 Tax=Agromyces sp. Marseille-Q5079 TaxID=3439059 RepID=UPI003D9CBD71